MAREAKMFCNGKIVKGLFLRKACLLFLSFVVKISFTFNTLSLVYIKRKENKEVAIVVWF